MSRFEVTINEKLSKINDYLALEGISGSIVFKGKLHDKPGDVSFRETFAKD